MLIHIYLHYYYNSSLALTKEISLHNEKTDAGKVNFYLLIPPSVNLAMNY